MACLAMGTVAAPAGAAPLLLRAADKPRPSAEEVAEARRDVHEHQDRLGTAVARLAQARARLDELNAGAERLVEAYNGELVRLRQAEQALQAATDRLRAADAQVAEARAAVAALAAQSYGGVDLSQPMVIMVASGGGGLPGYLHQASTLHHLSAGQAEVLKELRDAQTAYGILQGQTRDAYGERLAVAGRAERAKAAAEEAVLRQQAETGGLREERDLLERRLTAARSTADRLARTRAASMERARFRRTSAAASKIAKVPKSASSSRMGDVAANWALTQLGKPYVWAADGPDSYDCSGLTMRAWEQVGVRLDHWTGTQWTSGPHIPTGDLRRGDLVFFGRITSNPGDIHHVGIYIGRGMMVHAPQTGDVVRIAPIWRSDLVGATRPT
ncbi:hypothetical protein Misp01_53900 [Microtetraspora sp. NBRC 13810]|nr:hypothetical protein Misp01_53900 [Microtetraspora sp. NBRC 13810]